MWRRPKSCSHSRAIQAKQRSFPPTWRVVVKGGMSSGGVRIGASQTLAEYKSSLSGCRNGNLKWWFVERTSSLKFTKNLKDASNTSWEIGTVADQKSAFSCNGTTIKCLPITVMSGVAINKTHSNNDHSFIRSHRFTYEVPINLITK